MSRLLLNPEQMEILLTKLIERTTSGQFSWEQVGESDEYALLQPPFSYFISSRDGDGAAPYQFQIWRKRKDRDDYAMVQEVGTQRGGLLNEPLRLLYGAAFSSTLGIESLWDDILKNLED